MTGDNKVEILDSLRNFDLLPKSAQVRQPVVEGLFGISGATVWRRVRDGQLPQPQRHGLRTTSWNVGALREVLARGGVESEQAKAP